MATYTIAKNGFYIDIIIEEGPLYNRTRAVNYTIQARTHASYYIEGNSSFTWTTYDYELIVGYNRILAPAGTPTIIAEGTFDVEYPSNGRCLVEFSLNEVLFYAENHYDFSDFIWGDSISFYLTDIESLPQDIYIENGKIHAKSFIIDRSLKNIQIDNQGNIYASEFVQDSSFGIHGGTVYAVEFIEGLPM